MSSSTDTEILCAAISTIRESGRRDVGAEFFKRKLRITLGRALELVQQLQQYGVLGHNKAGNHPVLTTELSVVQNVALAESLAAPAPTNVAPQIPSEPEISNARGASGGVPATETVVHEVEESDPELELDSIRTAAEAQLRAGLDKATIDDYAEKMRQGVRFPPIDVFFDKGIHIVADGHHRLEAARKAGIQRVRVRLVQGDARSAILHALSANSTHGLPLSRRERRAAVVKMIQDPEWCQWSNEELARRCGISAMSVSRIRRQYDSDKVRVASRKCRGRNGRVRTMNVSRIGSGGRRKNKNARKSARTAADTNAVSPINAIAALQKCADDLLTCANALSDHLKSDPAAGQRLQQTLRKLLESVDSAVSDMERSSSRSAA